jgi:stage V sporulation protein D (sporulation-specific penicillin-binding protein)
LGQKIGAATLYRYYDAFGFFDTTGFADIGDSGSSGERSGYFWNLNDVGSVELATMSFGQRFRITPLQMITAVSAIANDGVLMQPRIAKEITNTDTGAVTTIEPVEVRQVVSKETSANLMDMLKTVVDNGTGRYAQVKGYSIAGKTGTSEPDPSDEEAGYVASFAAITPAESPELVILVTLYGLSEGGLHSGSTVAAPVVSQILSEVLLRNSIRYYR